LNYALVGWMIMPIPRQPRYEMQQEFAQNDLSLPNPFIDILNWGYGVILHAHQLGDQ